MPPPAHRVVIYARVSTSRQETLNQVAQLRAYANKMGWEVTKVLRETRPGWEPNREKLRELMDMASRKEMDLALVWALDRFSRQGIGPTLRLVDQLHQSGVGLWSYREPFLRATDPAIADLILSMLAWVAKQEHVRISERTKAGLARVKAKGKHLGRPRTHQIDAEEAVRLRRSGKSWSEVLSALKLPRTALSSVQRACSSRRVATRRGESEGPQAASQGHAWANPQGEHFEGGGLQPRSRVSDPLEAIPVRSNRDIASSRSSS